MLLNEQSFYNTQQTNYIHILTGNKFSEDERFTVRVHKITHAKRMKRKKKTRKSYQLTHYILVRLSLLIFQTDRNLLFYGINDSKKKENEKAFIKLK